jgi:hypothetical protein
MNLLRGDTISDPQLYRDDAVEVDANNLTAEPEHQATGWIDHGASTPLRWASRFIANWSMKAATPRRLAASGFWRQREQGRILLDSGPILGNFA